LTGRILHTGHTRSSIKWATADPPWKEATMFDVEASDSEGVRTVVLVGEFDLAAMGG
jgi:hypothetical protein